MQTPIHLLQTPEKFNHHRQPNQNLTLVTFSRKIYTNASPFNVLRHVQPDNNNNNDNNLHLYSANLYMNILGCALQYCYIKFMFKVTKAWETIKNYNKKY